MEEDDALGLLLALADEAAAPESASGGAAGAKRSSPDTSGLDGSLAKRRRSSDIALFGALKPAQAAERSSHSTAKLAGNAEHGAALEKFSGLRVCKAAPVNTKCLSCRIEAQTATP